MSLYVLSSETDPAEIGFIRKTTIKEKGTEKFFYKKSARLPSCERPVKILQHLMQLLAIQK
jgi:hypothetical protein